MRARTALSFTVILAAMCVSVCGAFCDVTEEFHKTFFLNAGSPVRVDNISGRVKISTWDRKYADVRAIKRMHGGRDDLKQVGIEVDADEKLYIRTVFHRGGKDNSFFSRLFGDFGSGMNVSVDYTITLPRTALLEKVATTSADIEIRDTRGATTAQTVSGSVRLVNTAGPVDLKTTSGDIEMTGGVVSSVRTVSGDIHLRGISGNMTLNSTSGDITVDGGSGRADVHSVSGNVSIRGPLVRGVSTISGDLAVSPSLLTEAAEFSSVSGDIHLRIPSDANADVEMNTVSGELVNSSDVELKVFQMSKRKINARIGLGGKALTIHTTSGDVYLEKE